MIRKVKNTLAWTYIISHLKGEEIVGTFCKKELQKTNQKKFRTQKVKKRKDINFMLNGKATIVLLKVGSV